MKKKKPKKQEIYSEEIFSVFSNIYAQECRTIIYKNIIKSILLYGAVAWTISKVNENVISNRNGFLETINKISRIGKENLLFFQCKIYPKIEKEFTDGT